MNPKQKRGRGRPPHNSLAINVRIPNDILRQVRDLIIFEKTNLTQLVIKSLSQYIIRNPISKGLPKGKLK